MKYTVVNLLFKKKIVMVSLSVVIDVVVKRSKINGLGIFAARNFKKDAIVIKWNAYRELQKQDLENLSKADREHVSFIEGKYILVPADCWVNHSCDSNVRLENFTYVAKKDIKKGDELTADYRKESESGFSMKCTCGSKKCKGTITVK